MATGAGRGARAWFRGGDRSSVAQSIASRRRGSRGCEAPAPLVPAPRSHRERQLGCSARARTGRLRYQAHRGWLAGDTRAAGACSGRRGGARWTAFTLYGLLARDQLRWLACLKNCTLLYVSRMQPDLLAWLAKNPPTFGQHFPEIRWDSARTQSTVLLSVVWWSYLTWWL